MGAWGEDGVGAFRVRGRGRRGGSGRVGRWGVEGGGGGRGRRWMGCIHMAAILDGCWPL